MFHENTLKKNPETEKSIKPETVLVQLGKRFFLVGLIGTNTAVMGCERSEGEDSVKNEKEVQEVLMDNLYEVTDPERPLIFEIEKDGIKLSVKEIVYNLPHDERPIVNIYIHADISSDYPGYRKGGKVPMSFLEVNFDREGPRDLDEPNFSYGMTGLAFLDSAQKRDRLSVVMRVPADIEHRFVVTGLPLSNSGSRAGYEASQLNVDPRFSLRDKVVGGTGKMWTYSILPRNEYDPEELVKNPMTISIVRHPDGSYE